MTFKQVSLVELLRTVHEKENAPGVKVIRTSEFHLGWCNTKILGIRLDPYSWEESPLEEIYASISWYINNTLKNSKFAFIHINHTGNSKICLLEDKE